ncbi:mucin-5AC-like isoform X1 [Dermacentor silvarum]|uniref:mucin-5AC-like isoform X1 n=2 Tax=Dermacentor silvarum TaxID=543639 RepID=UPI00210173E3|nr:mucin-5AC-like isoform X1 [Dermacentor silvarum]
MMLNMDTMRIGSTVELSVEPTPVEPTPVTPPVDAEPPLRLERSPVVQVEPAKPLVHKKGALRSFFWGTGSVGKEHPPRHKRKKELIQELADLQRENERLQSECNHMRLIYSELKQERLIDLEKVSRAKAQERKLRSETEFMSSASQTDPCNNLFGEFKAVPRKNYAFIYNVFTVPTPEQLKRSLDKFQKSSPKIGFKVSSKSEVKNKSDQNDARDDEVKPEVHTDNKDGVAEKTPQEVVEMVTEEPAKNNDEPKAGAQIESPVDEESGGVFVRTDPPDVRSSDSASVHEPSAKQKLSMKFSSYETDRSGDFAVAEGGGGGLVLPAQTESPLEASLVELKEPELPAVELKELQSRPSNTTVKTNADDVPTVPPSQGWPQEESPAADDKNTTALDEAVLLSYCSSASKASVREDVSGAGSPREEAPAVSLSPSENKMSEKSSESSLLLKLRQAVSNMAASLEPDTSFPQPSSDKHDAAKSVREAPTGVEVNVETVPHAGQRYGPGMEPMTSRQFLPPNHAEAGVQRDPGRKEFEKRRRVSCGALKPPLQKAVVMNVTLCRHIESPAKPASGGSSRRGTSTPASAASTPRPWSASTPRHTVAGAQQSASTPIRQLVTASPQSASFGVGRTAMSTPLEKGCLSSDSGADSDCSADESSSEFHGSARNVANTALTNRTSGVSRGTASQASSARSAATTSATTATTTSKKKNFRKKRNSPRRAGSALPPLPSTSSSEESQRTPRRRRTGSSRAGASTRSTTYSGAPSTPSRTTRPPSSASPLSPVSVALSNIAETIADSDTSRPTTAFGPKDGASTKTSGWADSRATSTTAGAGSPLPSSKRRDFSRATTQSSLLSRPQRDLTSSEMSPSESETPTPTARRRFLAGNESEPSSVKCKRSIFETLSSAGYTHIDDHAIGSAGGHCENPPSGETRGRGQNVTADEGKTGRTQGTTPTDSRRDKGAKNKSAFVVQRADLYAPFPPKIMRTLLPSFIDVDPSVRPDKAPRYAPFDPGQHGDEKSSTSLFKDHWHRKVHKAPASPPKYARPPHWEGLQSCLLPSLYSFTDDSRVGDQVDRKMTRFDLGEVI